MNKLNLLAILYALLDSGTWEINQLVSWADSLIQRLEKPKTWLTEVSLSSSVGDGLKVINKTMEEFCVMLPDNIGDLLQNRGTQYLLMKSGDTIPIK